MKKQLLIIMLALFTLSTSLVLAQPILDPRPLDPTCMDLDNPLTPVPGRPYTYEVNIPNPPGDKQYRWYVTQNPEFAVGGVYNWGTALPIGGAILADGDVHYNALTADADEISLTWQSFNLATGQYVFVVIYVENEDLEGCVTNNLKVYRIQPIHAFTLTVANIDGGAISLTEPTEICVDDVQDAVFNPDWDGGNGGVVYNFGQNEFYFAVAAANFSGNYQLAASFTGLNGATPAGSTGQVATLYYGYILADVVEATTGGVAITAAETVIGEVVTPVNTSYGEGPGEGHMIYIRIVVEHNQFEAISPTNYMLALDGILPDGGGNYGDHNDANTYGDLNQTDCERNAFGPHNQVTQTLKPRPEVLSVEPPAPGYLPNTD